MAVCRRSTVPQKRYGETMELNNLFLTLSQQAQVEDPTLFPFSFNLHLVFVCLGVIFFVFRFLKQRKPYQMIMSAAMLCSLGIWLSESRKLFYFIGLLELIMLIAAFVTSIVCKKDENDEKPDGDGKESDEEKASDSADDEDSKESSDMAEDTYTDEEEGE